MKNRPLLSGCLILFLLISLGIIMGGARFVKELRPSVLEKELSGKANVRLLGRVYDIDQKANYQILYLNNNSIIYQNKSFKESKIIVYDEQKLNIKIGNQVEALGELTFYKEERNPGNFNQKLYYQKQGINAFVWASKVRILDGYVDKVRDLMYKFRLQWKNLLFDVLGKEDGAILSAMLLAEKSEMDEEIKLLYQANGVAHVLAISGLHLSIIGVGLYKIFRRMSGSFLVGGIAGVSFLGAYILMIGMSISVLRALIMFLFRVGADMVGRHYDCPTALSVAALITIIWKPLYLYDGGFWMSYGAVLAIILVFPTFEELSLQGFWISVSINLMTLPVLLYYFYEIPLYSVILNMIVVPLMTVVLLSGVTGSILCMMFGAASGIGRKILSICGVIFDIYEIACKVILKLSSSRIVAGQPEMWQIVAYYGCLAIVVVMWRYSERFQKKQKLLRIWIGILTMSSVAVMILSVDEMTSRCKGEMSVTMLDVGQGDGIFIKGPKGNTYFIDGGSSDVGKVGQYRIEPFLKSQGIGKIDYVFVSHGDSDHISGIREMINRIKTGVSIETIVFPAREFWDESLVELAQMAKENGVQIVEILPGQQLLEGEMRILCLAPVVNKREETYFKDSNAGSMVLSVNYGNFDMLFTGDVEGKGEERLTKNLEKSYSNVKWEVLKVAHHGSRNSSSEEFLDVVRPSYALISAGIDNAYGHPHIETYERLKSKRSKILSTQESGAITVVTDGEKMKVEEYLKKK